MPQERLRKLTPDEIIERLVPVSACRRIIREATRKATLNHARGKQGITDKEVDWTADLMYELVKATATYPNLNDFQFDLPADNYNGMAQLATILVDIHQRSSRVTIMQQTDEDPTVIYQPSRIPGLWVQDAIYNGVSNRSVSLVGKKHVPEAPPPSLGDVEDDWQD